MCVIQNENTIQNKINKTKSYTNVYECAVCCLLVELVCLRSHVPLCLNSHKGLECVVCLTFFHHLMDESCCKSEVGYCSGVLAMRELWVRHDFT